jgi:hypothetical protein
LANRNIRLIFVKDKISNNKISKIMGQYYKACVLKENKTSVIGFVYSHDYGNGLKLTEHSWITNNFVKAFESLIFKKPQRVVWAGDYAEKCKNRKTNVYQRCTDNKQLKPTAHLSETDTRFIVNYTKKMYVDKTKVPKDNDGWQIHPIPLLTCDGNGQGGGDFFGNDPNKLVGSWARDLISLETERPQKGYAELIFDLVE